MRKSIFKMSILFIFLILGLLLVACGGAENDEASKNNATDNEESEPASDVEQEVVIAMEAEPVGLSPTGISDINSYQTTNHLYENLFERDSETGEIVPHLATSYENPDDTTWIFELQEGVEFHDGTPFNAEAVKYTFEKLVDPDVGAPGAHYLKFMEEIEVVDDYTVKLTTDKPNADVLPVLALTTLAIISPEADQNQDLMTDPVGTGPFKFDSWTRGDRVILTKNEDYWGETPTLDKITFVIVPDSSTALSMLETGEADLVGNIEAEHIPRVNGMQDVKLIQEEGSAAYFYSFNMSKEPMNELDFRQAVAMAINTDDFIAQLEGIGFYSPTLFGPAVLYYDETVEGFQYDFDPDAAREIVEKNGYGDEEFILYTTADRDAYVKMAEITQAQLSEVGFNVKIEMMEWGTFLEATANGEHDMMVLNTSNSMTGLETLYGYFHSDGIGGNNRSIFSDEEFDEVISEARQTLDEEARQVLINDIHQQVIENALIVPMFHGTNTLGANELLEDVNVLPNGVINLKNAYIK